MTPPIFLAYGGVDSNRTNFVLSDLFAFQDQSTRRFLVAIQGLIPVKEIQPKICFSTLHSDRNHTRINAASARTPFHPHRDPDAGRSRGRRVLPARHLRRALRRNSRMRRRFACDSEARHARARSRIEAMNSCAMKKRRHGSDTRRVCGRDDSLLR